MRYIIFLLLFSFLFSGCGIFHVQEIMRIKAVSANMDEQQKYVDAKNEEFEKLLKIVKEGKISNYKTQKDFVKEFGDPVFSKQLSKQEEYSEVWLYRYCDKMFGSEKVYLYFDDAGNLIKWEHRLPKSQ
ncbi:MAG: hypothetical protein PHY73_02390 [Candidatus Omnitrophica bacterium]|nr:hypothetical protein [Candidatus Omnitrophota bacterium]